MAIEHLMLAASSGRGSMAGSSQRPNSDGGHESHCLERGPRLKTRGFQPRTMLLAYFHAMRPRNPSAMPVNPPPPGRPTSSVRREPRSQFLN